MKNLSSDMRLHIQQEVTSLCKCWILQTTQGQKLGFTDHDNDIMIEGVLCERDTGVEGSDVEERIGLNVNTSEIAGALSSNSISASDINAGKYDNASLSCYIVNWQKPDSYFLDTVSLVGEITQEDSYYKIEMRSLSSKLEQTVGKHFISRCQADLGDANCKVSFDQSAFTTNGEVSDVLSEFIIRVKGFDEFENSWFRGGRLTWKTGLNIGKTMEITEHIKFGNSTQIHLWQPMPFQVRALDTLSIQVGCDKEFATCKNKFANTINFRGFPHMPGSKFILNHSGNSDNFDGEPIIK